MSSCAARSGRAPHHGARALSSSSAVMGPPSRSRQLMDRAWSSHPSPPSLATHPPPPRSMRPILGLSTPATMRWHHGGERLETPDASPLPLRGRSSVELPESALREWREEHCLNRRSLRWIHDHADADDPHPVATAVAMLRAAVTVTVLPSAVTPPGDGGSQHRVHADARPSAQAGPLPDRTRRAGRTTSPPTQASQPATSRARASPDGRRWKPL